MSCFERYLTVWIFLSIIAGILLGEQIIAQPLVITLLAVPIAIQTYAIFGIGYIWNLWGAEAHCIGSPSALIGASNVFELAVAATISLFGLNSGRPSPQSSAS